MNNLSKIRKLSGFFVLLISVMLVAIPLYNAIYWTFLNHLPDVLITKNITTSIPLVENYLPVQWRLVGFVVGLFPLSALIWGLINIRRLFVYYREGSVFSFEHVRIFRKTATALIWWVFLSIIYESAKSILFSMGNPPGQRVVSVGFSSSDFTTLFVAGMVYVIAWVMDEGRIMAEEQRLII